MYKYVRSGAGPNLPVFILKNVAISCRVGSCSQECCIVLGARRIRCSRRKKEQQLGAHSFNADSIRTLPHCNNYYSIAINDIRAAVGMQNDLIKVVGAMLDIQ